MIIDPKEIDSDVAVKAYVEKVALELINDFQYGSKDDYIEEIVARNSSTIEELDEHKDALDIIEFERLHKMLDNMRIIEVANVSDILLDFYLMAPNGDVYYLHQFADNGRLKARLSRILRVTPFTKKTRRTRVC